MAVSMKPFSDFIKVLSWQKLIQAALFLLLLMLAWGFWENRATIYNSIKVGARVETDAPLIINLSNGTKSYMDGALNKSKDLVAGIQIVNVNFKKNTRNTSYFFLNDPLLKTTFDAFQASKVADIPLFTDSEINNQRLINLINGDFICNDYKDTPAGKFMSAAAKNIPQVCAISIPPYYGRFSGFMNIYLLRKPDSEDLVFIRQIARDLSLKIYESDIDRSSDLAVNKN